MLYLVTQSCPTLCDPMDCSLPGSSVHGDSLGKNTGVGCHALLQGIFPTQGSNLCLAFNAAHSHDWQVGLALGTEASVLFHMNLSSVLLDRPFNRLSVSHRVSPLREEG